MPVKKKPLKKKLAKKKPKATMSQSVRQTVIVNQPTTTRKRKSKAKAKSKSDSQVIASLVDKFVNLSAEQAKINNTITQAKQTVKVEDIAPIKTAPVSKISGMDDLELKKIKKAEPIATKPLSGIEKIKKATSLLEAQGNILSHLSRKKPPSAPTLSDDIDSLSAGLRTAAGLGKGGSKYNPLRTQSEKDITAIMEREEGGFAEEGGFVVVAP